MPWHVERRGAEWCVIKDTDDSVAGCSPTEAEANQHMAALYASEAGGHAASVEGCSCKHTAPTVVAAFTEPLDASFPTPAYPSRSMFDEPDWIEPGQSLTVLDDGRVGGYFYDKGSCLIHMHGACPKPSPTRYAAFHQQSVILDDGTSLEVGVIGNTQGHADEYGSISSAQAHYANPDAQMMIVRAGDNEHGGWVAGVLVPGLTYGDVALVRRCALSGDWRPMPASWWRAHNIPRRAVAECEGYDCIGPTLVNRPGLPLVRQYARTAAAVARWTPEWETLDDTEGVTVKVTIEGEPGPVTEVATAMQPVVQAASPPPPPPAEEEAPPAGDLEERVAQLEAVVAEIVAMIEGANQQQAASVAAAVKPVPPRNGQMVVADFVDNEKITVPA